MLTYRRADHSRRYVIPAKERTRHSFDGIKEPSGNFKSGLL
jgi:hypothetical protein